MYIHPRLKSPRGSEEATSFLILFIEALDVEEASFEELF